MVGIKIHRSQGWYSFCSAGSMSIHSRDIYIAFYNSNLNSSSSTQSPLRTMAGSSSAPADGETRLILMKEPWLERGDIWRALLDVGEGEHKCIACGCDFIDECDCAHDDEFYYEMFKAEMANGSISSSFLLGVWSPSPKDTTSPRSPSSSKETYINGLTCPLCKAMHLDKKRLNNHILSHVQPCKGDTCPICKTTLPNRKRSREHIRSHTKPFQCSATGCSAAFARKLDLQRHIKAVPFQDKCHQAAASQEGILPEVHYCAGIECDYRTSRQDEKRRHMRWCWRYKSRVLASIPMR
ncbi:hypothetical protein F5883DRAFT_594448 [Diaporthe sp. PMI_573]|nr:hypothetical protein F5883DRAFT_594448 [Diaporthaceae sp. PMI_573]